MPTYEYRCDACGHEMELFQSFSESAKRKCPACSRLKLKRLIGMGGGIIFKGSGFYETDYRSDSYKKGVEADKQSAEKPKADKADKPDKKSAQPAKESKQADSPKQKPKDS